MNARTLIRIALLVSFAAPAFSQVAFAAPPSSAPEKMDSETHTIVIEKLESVLSKAKEDETINMRPIRARLADLYSERARLRAMDEAEKNCQDCTGAKDDRKRAIDLYATVIREAQPSEQGALFMQKAHLHEMQNEPTKARAIYDSMIQRGPKEYGRNTIVQAYMGRGEIRYAKGEFGKAKPDFEAAERLLPANDRGYAMYRAAWCELNLGDQPKATRMLLTLLKSPELLTRPTTNGKQFDGSFQEDVSRDLASFLAHGTVTRHEIATLVNASPASAKRENIRYLANECERLGSRASALIAWDAFIAADGGSDDRLEAMIHVAQIRYEMGDRAKAASGLKAAADHWIQHGCKEDAAACDNMRLRFRRIAIDWNRAEKKKPTAELLAAYKAYLSKFDADVEMTHWAGLVARERQASKDAWALFQRSAWLASDRLRTKLAADGSGKPATPEDAKSCREILEASLVGAIEMAEQSKDPAARLAAYDQYMKLNPTGPKSIEVRYQRARLPYESGDNAGASNRLHEFAASEDCRRLGRSAKDEDRDAGLCGKAADLDLDALAALKQDPIIEKRAQEYAQIYPSRASEYSEMSRKAALNQVAAKSNGSESASDVRAALAKLNGVSLVGASREDQITYWKNRLKLAEKAQDLGESERSANGLLAVKGLGDEDREYGLSRLEWAAEMKLDFATAYRVSLKMKMAKLSSDDRLLRLALLAELAGRSPRKHQDELLRTTHDKQKAMAMRAKMVRDARSPIAELGRQSDLERSPQIYAPLALEVFSRTQNYGFAQRALKVRGVAQQPAGQLLARYIFLRDFSTLQRRLASHRIRSSSDALLGRTLSERLKMMNEAEDAAGRAIRAHDYTLELATLATLSRENQRLYGEIMRLPVPRRLRGTDRARYVNAIAARARPFKTKHDEIETKLAGFWADSRSLEDAARSYERTRRELRPLLAKDIQAIATVAPPSVSKRLKTAMADDRRSLSGDLNEAREDVLRRPFNARSLQRLKQLEEQNGRDSMVAYLDARISQLKQGEAR